MKKYKIQFSFFLLVILGEKMLRKFFSAQKITQKTHKEPRTISLNYQGTTEAVISSSLPPNYIFIFPQ